MGGKESFHEQNNDSNLIINLKESIKSKYLIKKIFSFISEKKKLKIIIYNKKYQDLFAIKLENYQNISERYIEGKRNGKGKEFSSKDGKLLFEGEYKNGKRHGKGKEYIYFPNWPLKELKFEGYYLNGRKHGKGREYDYFDFGIKFTFDGEYYNGDKLIGKGYDRYNNLILKIDKDKKGKEYFNDGKLKFEGEYLKGLRHGNGKEYYMNGALKFEGEYLKGLRCGKGKEYYMNGTLKFEGKYFNGIEWDGKGYTQDGILEYEFIDGLQQ